MAQPLIKLILLAAIAAVGYFAVRGSKRALHRVVWRGYVVTLLAVAPVCVVFPNLLTWAGQRVGVGRGTDLLLYILVVSFMLVSVILFRRVDALERRYVALARTLSIREAMQDSSNGAEAPTHEESGS